MKLPAIHHSFRVLVFAGLLLLVFAGITPSGTGQCSYRYGQDSAGIKFKVQFIHQLGQIARDELGFKIDSNFYKSWQEKDDYYYYIYCSSPDSICNVLKSPYEYLGTDEEKAKKKKQHYDSLNYQVMVYKTAGTSAARLNKALLSYPYETISFIVFHEAFHQHASATGRKLPYEMEEAACDILGNYITQMLEKRFSQYSRKEAKNLVSLHENLYATINKYDSMICMTKGNVPTGLYTFCYDDIQKLLKKSSQFQQDRFSYPVNNAYFVRYRYYASNYFLLKKLYVKYNDPKKFVDVMTNLSKEEPEARKILENKIKE
ncbi:MAG: hypothetical protein AB1458_06770 [Bacteroidota bacterium]